MDYRVINFEKILDKYIEFLNERKNSEKNNTINEFEPRYLTIEKIFEKVGFKIKTLIIFFIPYFDNKKNIKSGNISIHSMSKDYHYISQNILEKYKNQIIGCEYNTYIQCDVGVFNERFFAINSGLCMKGLNGLAIHEEYGSYGFLGIIATDKEMDEYITDIKECLKCNLCIKNCPSKAITENSLNSNICVSYLTQKKNLDKNEEEIVKKSKKVFGCDICQEVCPHNIKIKNTQIEDFNENLVYNISLEDISNLSNKEFKKIFGDRNFSWRGKKIIIRNLELQNE